MRFGTPEMAATSRRRAPQSCAAAGRADRRGRRSAQEKPTLKDVLGRVQSESETKAVEDLVDKLKGTARKPAARPHRHAGARGRRRAARSRRRPG